jgi:hypothetical protein
MLPRRPGCAGGGPADPPAPFTAPAGPVELDLRRAGISTVIWATGYQPAYPWLTVPVLDRHGEIAHRRGVTSVPGFYVLGLKFLYCRNSTFVDGVGSDARFVAAHLTRPPTEQSMSIRNTQHYDVVIAGARCAGAATALLLARQGARVLLDRSRYGTDTLSTHALMQGAVVQLHRWGLLPGMIEAGTPPVRSTTFHLPDTVATVHIKPKYGAEALYAPRRTVLDAILADACSRHCSSPQADHGCSPSPRCGAPRSSPIPAYSPRCSANSPIAATSAPR